MERKAVIFQNVLHVAYIASEHVPAVLDACGDALEEAVLTGIGLVEACEGFHHETYLQVGGKRQGEGIADGGSLGGLFARFRQDESLALDDEGGGADFQAVSGSLGGSHHILEDADLVGELIIGVNGFAIDAHNLVALLETYLRSGGSCHHAIHLGGNERTDK